MNSPRCCLRNARAGQEARPPRTGLRRIREAFGWIVPGALLALMPKCPMCLAAYVALGTGFAMSHSSARIFMRTLTAVCIGMLTLCVARRVVSCCHHKQTFDLQPTHTR